jgi:hypothetical protein
MNELKDAATEITKYEQATEKRTVIKMSKASRPVDNRRCHTCATDLVEGEGQKVIRIMMAENFPNLGKDIKMQFKS